MMTVGVVFVSMGAWMLTWLQTGLQVFLSIKGHFGDTPGCIAKFQGLEPATALPPGVQWIQLEGPNVCKNQKTSRKNYHDNGKIHHFQWEIYLHSCLNFPLSCSFSRKDLRCAEFLQFFGLAAPFFALKEWQMYECTTNLSCCSLPAEIPSPTMHMAPSYRILHAIHQGFN